ncbi:iron complex transport system permease protein [Leucobacter luti]|uniref:iron chelate uptake ABC transporter family permease subunit n=1 Tax=Leucobacter luti TaxID=340320 RepID=UPI001051C005|nr:iron chelate uptake ABC transporter family permease subunit [Leucobacter luti]MCW2289052.1 iron complex transport system permease protein [Leucobacter luti]TCK35547.1 iron complex transport system permease protein [Leucobacter luti]
MTVAHQTTVTRSAVRFRRRAAWLALSVVLLLAVSAASIAIGSAALPLSTVWSAFTAPDGGIDHATILTLRVPRTLLGLLIGASLAVAGALMQGLTRNPLGDPGILGVNAGAGFAIVLGVSVWGVTRISDYLWFGFLGAVVAGAVVYAVAARGPGGATPLRLTLVGVALSAVLMGFSHTLAMLNTQTFDRMRFWGAGTLADRPDGTIAVILPFITAGFLLAVTCARGMNALALGDDLARSVGSRVGWTRARGMLAVTLLCGAATAAAGPIGFVGLMVPHAVRFLVGPDQRWILPFSLVLGPVLVLSADVLGRIIVAPAELQVGVVTAFLGAPVLIALVRGTRVGGL